MGKKSGIRETDEKRAGCGILAKKGRECGIRIPPSRPSRSGYRGTCCEYGELRQPLVFSDTIDIFLTALQAIAGKIPFINSRLSGFRPKRSYQIISLIYYCYIFIAVRTNQRSS